MVGGKAEGGIGGVELKSGLGFCGCGEGIRGGLVWQNSLWRDYPYWLCYCTGMIFVKILISAGKEG